MMSLSPPGHKDPGAGVEPASTGSGPVILPLDDPGARYAARSSSFIARRKSNVAEKEARSILGWHALSLRRAWRPFPINSTPFEDSGRATQTT